MMEDRDFLIMAIEEGKKGRAPYLFGAVVVKDGEVIAIDHNHVAERTDPTAHAEVSALVLAAKKLGSQNMPGATLYASHEPCMMCFSCAAWAEIDRIVFATPASAQNPDMYEFKGVSIFEMADKLQRPIKVERLKI